MLKFFSALTRNVGKLREMKKAHEEMAAELAQLKAEKEQAGSKLLELNSSKFAYLGLFFLNLPFFRLINRCSC